MTKKLPTREETADVTLVDVTFLMVWAVLLAWIQGKSLTIKTPISRVEMKTKRLSVTKNKV